MAGLGAVSRVMKPLSPDRRGVILISVLWIMVGLSVLALALAETVRTEAALARASGDAEQAYFFARGAMEAVLYRIAFPDPDRQKQQALFPYAGGMNHYWLSNGRMIGHVAITDEAGRLDLNLAEEETLGRLLRIVGVSEPRAEAIARSMVRRRNPASAAGGSAGRRQPFRFVEELLGTPGVSRELLYGRPRRQKDGRVAYRRGLADFLTVHTGANRINVNYAEAEVLAALPGMSWDKAQSLVKARRREPLQAADLSSRSSAEALPFLTTQPSETFCLVATAWLKGSATRRSLKVVARRGRQFKLRHHRWVWYDQYWPPPAVRKFSRPPPPGANAAGIHSSEDPWTS